MKMIIKEETPRKKRRAVKKQAVKDYASMARKQATYAKKKYHGETEHETQGRALIARRKDTKYAPHVADKETRKKRKIAKRGSKLALKQHRKEHGGASLQVDNLSRDTYMKRFNK